MDSKLYGAGNVAKTTILLAGIGGLLVGIGFLLGGMGGAVIGLLFGVGISGFSYWKSDSLAIRASGAVPVSEQEAPNLHWAVGEIARRAGIPKPRVYFIDSPQPNAFATGRNPHKAVVAVTRGILKLMPPEELRGVLAHEMGHIKNRDILIQSVAAVLATAIMFLGNMLRFAAFFGGSRDDNRGGNPIAAIALAILAPIAAMLIQMAISRSREFLADATGAGLAGDPKPLAMALQRLSNATKQLPMQGHPATENLFIVNPFSGRGLGNLFATHPPVEERVRRLLAMKKAA